MALQAVTECREPSRQADIDCYAICVYTLNAGLAWKDAGPGRPIAIQGRGDANACRSPAETGPGSGGPALPEGPVGQACRSPAGFPQPRDDCRGGPAGGRGPGAD